jgi:RNA polymerase sigma factor (sigma-70 family)
MHTDRDLQLRSDEELLHRMRECPRAEAILRKRYHRKVTGLLRRAYPRIDHEYIADEVITKCVLTYSRRPVRSSFEAALYVAARNAGRAAQMQEDARAETSLDGSQLDERLPMPGLSPEVTIVERLGLEQALAEALSSLTSWQRRLFLLRHREQLSPREIARRLETTESAVKSGVHQAVKRLKAHPALAAWNKIRLV